MMKDVYGILLYQDKIKILNSNKNFINKIEFMVYFLMSLWYRFCKIYHLINKMFLLYTMILRLK